MQIESEIREALELASLRYCDYWHCLMAYGRCVGGLNGEGIRIQLDEAQTKLASAGKALASLYEEEYRQSRKAEEVASG